MCEIVSTLPSVLATLPPAPLQQYRTTYVLEPAGPADPERRLRMLQGRRALFGGYEVITDAAQLSAALSRHRTPDDVPANTDAARRALAAELRRGRRLVQYRLSVPDTARERQDGPTIITEPLPIGTPVLGNASLTGLMAANRRAVYHAMQHGLLDVILSRWRGRTYQYAVVNDRLAEWSRRYARWVPQSAVVIPGSAGGHGGCRAWFTWEDVGPSMFRKTNPLSGRPLVYASYPLVRWAAMQRPRSEWEAILKAQVTR